MRSDRIQGKFAKNGLLVIPVHVMQYELDFMVDTGASFCVLRKSVARRLALKFDTKRTIKIIPASKHPILAPLTEISMLRVGGVLMHNLSVVLLDLHDELNVSGLLGMNFIRKFRMCIEPDTATLVLRNVRKS